MHEVAIFPNTADVSTAHGDIERMQRWEEKRFPNESFASNTYFA